MRHALLIVLGLLISAPAWSFSEKSLATLKATNECRKCDLDQVNLRKADLRNAQLESVYMIGAKLRGINLSGANLENAIMRGAILCKTKLPSGEDNSGCR